MKIYPDEAKILLSPKKDKEYLLVQIGRDIFTLHLRFEDVSPSDLKRLLNTEDIRLLKDE